MNASSIHYKLTPHVSQHCIKHKTRAVKWHFGGWADLTWCSQWGFWRSCLCRSGRARDGSQEHGEPHAVWCPCTNNRSSSGRSPVLLADGPGRTSTWYTNTHTNSEIILKKKKVIVDGFLDSWVDWGILKLTGQMDGVPCSLVVKMQHHWLYSNLLPL